VTPVLWYSKVSLLQTPGPLPWPAITEVGPLILSTLLLLCSSAVPAGTAQTSVAIETPEPATRAIMAAIKPDAPTPKVSVDSSEPEPGAESRSSSEPAPIRAPLKPATPESYETARQRKVWYGLMAAAHGAAAFDAWTTRRAISGGFGTEGDPLQRPFANSGAIYATTQILPALMDYLGYRMMRSEHPTLRKFWWLPQTASAGVSLGAGIHNHRVVH
jgi:hypothetical protein